jgi:uncharacterized protein (DUF302 family)
MFAPTIKLLAAAVLTSIVTSSAPAVSSERSAQKWALGDGVVKVKSKYSLDDTIARLKQDIANKGIMFFLAVDQSKLASDAGIKLRPSTLLVFGNPALGSHFITANPQAGLDWPVRLLVTQDERGTVWAVYTDFAWIARRHGIKDREAEFGMASNVIASITSSVEAN